MVMSLQERVEKASAAHVASARRKRFQRYSDEIERDAADMPSSLLVLAAQVLRRRGWTIVPPR